MIIIKSNHIKDFHNITNPPNLHEKTKKSKRKGRIYKIIQSKVQTQDNRAKDIIQLFNSNSSYF